jgi:hypothetical protein
MSNDIAACGCEGHADNQQDCKYGNIVDLLRDAVDLLRDAVAVINASDRIPLEVLEEFERLEAALGADEDDNLLMPPRVGS